MNLVCGSGMADASASGGAGQVPTQRGGKEVPLVRLRLRNSNSLHKDLNVSG